MSRATRPVRRVRGRELDQLSREIAALLGPTPWPVTMLVAPGRYGAAWWAARCARALGTRPSVARRCLLGLNVSARAARRILAAARGSR